MDTSAGSEMIAIPPGQVILSDRRTERSWPVELAPYRLAAFPITQARYAQVTGQRPSTAQGDQLPVESVSWFDAVRFCNALSHRDGLAPAYRVHAEVEGLEWDASADGYRLSTEAEWEHACLAGTTGPRHGRLDAIAWYRGNSEGRMHEVGGKRPNAWGLYDMLGNVWETSPGAAGPRCGAGATRASRSTTSGSASPVPSRAERRRWRSHRRALTPAFRALVAGLLVPCLPASGARR